MAQSTSNRTRVHSLLAYSLEPPRVAPGSRTMSRTESLGWLHVSLSITWKLNCIHARDDSVIEIQHISSPPSCALSFSSAFLFAFAALASSLSCPKEPATGTQACSPCCTPTWSGRMRHWSARARARRDPHESCALARSADKRREVGKGLSLADTQTGR